MLLRSGIACRGGVATGETFHNEHVVGGVGLIQAYRLEHELAIYPRIVVQDDLATHATGGFFDAKLKRDSGGLLFIDLFHELRRAEDPTAIMRGSLADGLRTVPAVDAFLAVRSYVVAALEMNQGQLRTHAKYRWLANQFNEAIAEYIPGRADPISFSEIN